MVSFPKEQRPSWKTAFWCGEAHCQHSSSKSYCCPGEVTDEKGARENTEKGRTGVSCCLTGKQAIYSSLKGAWEGGTAVSALRIRTLFHLLWKICLSWGGKNTFTFSPCKHHSCLPNAGSCFCFLYLTTVKKLQSHLLTDWGSELGSQVGSGDTRACALIHTKCLCKHSLHMQRSPNSSSLLKQEPPVQLIPFSPSITAAPQPCIPKIKLLAQWDQAPAGPLLLS